MDLRTRVLPKMLNSEVEEYLDAGGDIVIACRDCRDARRLSA